MNMDIAHNSAQHIGESSNDMPELQNNIINQLDLTFNSSILEDLSCNMPIPLTGINATDMEEEVELPHDLLEDMPAFEKLISSTPIVDNNNDYADVEIKIEEPQLQTQIFGFNQNDEEQDEQQQEQELQEKNLLEEEEEIKESEKEWVADTLDEQIFQMEDSYNETTIPASVTVIKKESFDKQQEEEKDETDIEKSIFNLSNSLVDHNYSTSIETPTTDELRNYLNNHLKEKANYANEQAQGKIMEFVEGIVSSINSFNINEKIKNDYDDNNNDNDDGNIKVSYKQMDFELFVQKVIDSVDPIEEAQFEKINVPHEEQDAKVKNLIKDEEEEMEKNQEKEEDKEEDTNAAQITEEVKELNLDEIQTEEYDKNKNIVLDKLMTFGQTLQYKCKSLLTSSSTENLTDFIQMQLNQLQKLIEHNTTTSLTATTKIATTTPTTAKCEISVQTEPSKKALRRMKKEQERQSKFKLKNGTSSSSSESSDSCSNSSSSSSSTSSSLCSKSSCDQLIHELKKKKRKKSFKKEENSISKFDTTTNMEVDSETQVKNEQCIKNNSNDNINEEDKEIERLINFDGLLKRPKYMPGNNSVPTKNLENSKQKVKLLAKDLLLDESNSEDDESDDDDEAKHYDEDGKLVDEKLKKFSNTCNGEEFAKHADDESEKEIITEKEYLKRYNDSLKQHFLNDSSSMSEDAEEVELIKGLCPQAENAEDVVDKFLESYDAEQDELAEVSEDAADESEKDKTKENPEQGKSDHIKKSANSNDDKFENNTNDHNNDNNEITAKQKNSELKNSLSEFIQLPKSPAMEAKADDADVEATTTSTVDKLLAEQKKDGSGSPVESTLSSSDCELLNDTSLLTKNRKSKKSLEVMITEAEKRKKASKVDSSDLISLSSASSSAGNSDAEDGEGSGPGQQSRVIKPMLRQDQLASETRRAQKLEADRIRRLDKKQASLTKILKERDAKNEQRAGKEYELILDYNSETKTFIKVHPHIVKQLKSHQIDGIKFMYDSCYGGVDALKKSTGSGCILAHCMGLGKTLQLIALLHTVISYKELKTNKILVLCPKSTVMNWADEIIRWLGPLNAKNLKVFTFSDTSDINEKLRVLRDWSLSTPKRAGCLLIGYEAFRSLVFYHSYKNRGNYGTTYMEEIREKVENFLLKPGADLVVCDEGHIIKNSKSAISLAVSKIITTKRIILTGTPIQNNLKEYYSMVNFIKPLFLGTEKEFANLYANPIKNGQHKDSSKRDIQVMKQRSFVLHKKLSKFVQRKEAELLKTFLPKKFEYVLFIPMSDVQNNLYEHILEAISRREENRGRSLITDYTCLRKIWTHPKVLEDAWTNAINQKNKKELARKIANAVHSDEDQPDDIYDSQTGVMSVTNDWWRQLISEKDLETILPSNKLRTMFEILRMCEEKDEKCLIFSAFVAVLNVVEFFFKKINSGDPVTLKELNIAPTSKLRNKWVLGQDYYRLDGKTAKNLRHEMVKRFNAASNRQARVFLISAKAGGQGINLIGANRVIILDTSWNPSNDQQNIFRIFRLGQKKNCYIYRILAMGTMEEKVYSRSVTKQAMSFRVVDEQQIDRHYSMAELAELYTLTKPNPADRPMPIFPQDSILASLLLNFPDMVYKYHEHDSLLENKVEQELSEQEKADAWAAYERDLQITSEIQEPPNMEGMRNSFNMPHLRNYFGLDMQTMLNYGNLTNPAATSPFMQSLLAQYNYPGTSQQYLEMLNLYSKYAQSPLAYPELNASAMAGGVYPSSTSAAHFGAGATKPTGLQSNTTGAAGLPNNNPLSALGDLTGLYGMGSAKNYPGMSMGGKPNSTASSMYMPHGANSAAAGTATSNIYADNNSMLLQPPSTYSNSGLGNSASSFKPTVPFSNLYNFNTDFPQHRTPNSGMNYTNSAANMHLTPMLNNTTNQPSPSPSQQQPSSSSASPFSLPSSNATNLSKGNSIPTSTRTIDLTKTSLEYNKNSQPPPLVDLTRIPFKDSSSSGSSSNNRNIKSISSLSVAATTTSTSNVNLMSMSTLTSTNAAAAATGTGAITTATAATTRPNVTINELQRTLTTTKTPATSKISELPPSGKATTNTNSSINNRGIIRPGFETVKPANNEMIIIPTTSPPGPTSVSKQFTEISPSISLTAVRSNNNNNNKSNTPSNVNAPTLTTITNNKNSSSNSNNKSISTPTLLPISSLSTKTNNKGPINNAAISSLKLYRPGKQVQPQPQQQQQQSQIIATTSTAAIAKTITTPTSSSNKNNSKTTLSSNTNDSSSNNSSALNKSPTITVAKFANMATRRTNTPTNSNNNNNNIKIISNNNNNTATATPGTPKSSVPTTTPIKKTYINPAAAKQTPINSNATTAYPPLVNINTRKGNNSNNNAKSSTVGRSGTTISPPLTAVQLQKLRAIGANTPPGSNNNNNSSSTRSGMVRSNTSGISIRPVEIHEKTNNKSSNVIIETNINDKRVAIGAPTKSGNGTTVTKISVPLKRKRPNAEPVETTTDSNKRRRE